MHGNWVYELLSKMPSYISLTFESALNNYENQTICYTIKTMRGNSTSSIASLGIKLCLNIYHLYLNFNFCVVAFWLRTILGIAVLQICKLLLTRKCILWMLHLHLLSILLKSFHFHPKPNERKYTHNKLKQKSFRGL